MSDLAPHGQVSVSVPANVPATPAADWALKPAAIAAARILVWRETLQSIFATAEAEVLACCAAIRREHPEREDFNRFCAGALHGVLSPAQAWLRADTWEVARRHRPVRELTVTQPRKAVAFVAEFVAAAEGEQLELPLDADDREIADLLAASPKVRRARLRELTAARRAAREKRNPDDVARIAQLERETAATTAETSVAKQKAALDDELAAHERGLAETAGRYKQLIARGAYSEHELQRVLRRCDMAAASLDTIAETAHEHQEAK